MKDQTGHSWQSWMEDMAFLTILNGGQGYQISNKAFLTILYGGQGYLRSNRAFLTILNGGQGYQRSNMAFQGAPQLSLI